MRVVSNLRVKWFNNCVGLLFRCAEEYHQYIWLGSRLAVKLLEWKAEQFQLLLA